MTDADFVDVPTYDLQKLAVLFRDLLNPRNIAEITRKLFYSTKFLVEYDLDAPEYSGIHTGVDLKLPIGTPIGAIAGGRVVSVSQDNELGLHVVIEHHIDDKVFYSIYGHFGFAKVKAGDDVTAGQFIGTVGMTGATTGPHLHLQVDPGIPGETSHTPYVAAQGTPRGTAEQFTINPITFIQRY